MSLAFSDISPESLAELEALQAEPVRQAEAFARALPLTQAVESGMADAVATVLRDQLYLAFRYAEEHQWQAHQQSAFISIMKETMLHSLLRPANAALSLQESFDLFSHMIVQHAVERPPTSFAVFSLAQVRELTQYVSDTFFKHYAEFVAAAHRAAPRAAPHKVKLTIPHPPALIPALFGSGVVSAKVEEYPTTAEHGSAESPTPP